MLLSVLGESIRSRKVLLTKGTTERLLPCMPAKVCDQEGTTGIAAGSSYCSPSKNMNKSLVLRHDPSLNEGIALHMNQRLLGMNSSCTKT